MIASFALILWAPAAAGMCYMLGVRRDGGHDGGKRLDPGGVPPPTITRITTTQNDRVVAP